MCSAQLQSRPRWRPLLPADGQKWNLLIMAAAHLRNHRTTGDPACPPPRDGNTSEQGRDMEREEEENKNKDTILHTLLSESVLLIPMNEKLL